MMWSMWNVQDDKNPARRISFGTNRTRADQFAESLEGWTVRSDSDPDWMPITGRTPGSDEATGRTS